MGDEYHDRVVEQVDDELERAQMALVDQNPAKAYKLVQDARRVIETRAEE